MTLAEVIGLVVLVLALCAHTAAMFYWGGGVRQMLRDHDRRIGAIERRSIPLKQEC